MKYQYKNLKWAFFSLFLLIVAHAGAQQKNEAAQDKTYTGAVTDENNVPIPGVLVEVQEKDISVTTDNAGRFSLEASADDVLIFKFAGYLTAQTLLSQNTNVNVSLTMAKTFAGEDDDVQIPFGVRKKRYLTKAISSIDEEELPRPATGSLTNVLSGRLAGLTVLQDNARPGTDLSSFRVRGRTSFGYNNAKVLVDGTEREFADLDINEIESITVLKDAASLAWYGLRGSNGVVLVTTKRGSATENSIRLDSYVGLQATDNLIRPLNSFDYATLYNEAQLNDNPNAVPLYDQATLNSYQNGTDPFLFPNNNYVDRFLKSSAPIQRHVVSARGGSSRVRYYALLGYMDQQGLFTDETKGPDYNSNTAYKRFNFRGNIDFDVTKDLYVSLNLAGRAENRINPGNNNTNNILGAIYTTRPNAYPILNADGTLGGTQQDQDNILGLLTRNGVRRSVQRVGLANMGARYKLDGLVKGLSANALFSYDSQGDFNSGFTQNFEVFDSRGATPEQFRTEGRLNYLGGAGNFNESRRRNELWFGFDYDRSFNVDHRVKASIRGMRGVSSNFVELDERIQGFSSRVDYAFKDKYLLGLVAGYYGDDDLPPGDRYGFFPAVSAGWILSEENFLKDNDILSFLKLRVSHGKTGNSQIGFSSRFGYRSYYDRNSTSNGYQFGTGWSESNTGLELNIGNPFITYETLTSTNAGVDFNLFKNSLSATVDVFKGRRSGILTSGAIPVILGQNTGSVNQGIVDSKGIESSLFYNKDIGQVNLSFNANILVARDKVIAEGGQLGLAPYQQTIGLSAGSALYYLSDGIFQNTAEIAAAPKSTLVGDNLVFPGDIRYKDVNGDNVIDALDRVMLDFDQPAYYGFGTSIRYKMFDINAQFQGVSNYNINIQGIVNAGPDNLNQQSFNRWTPATAANAQYPRLGLANRGNNTATSDFWLRDASFVKLKAVELGFNLPQNLAAKIKTKNVRLYLSGFNLLTFTKLDLDVDPELPFLGQTSGSYPYTKTYAVGLSAKF